MKGIRSLRLPLRRDDTPDNYHEVLDGFLDVMQTVREAYPTVEPSPAFRDALHARLLAEAAWLKDHPVETPREAAMKRSAAGSVTPHCARSSTSGLRSASRISGESCAFSARFSASPSAGLCSRCDAENQ